MCMWNEYFYPWRNLLFSKALKIHVHNVCNLFRSRETGKKLWSIWLQIFTKLCVHNTFRMYISFCVMPINVENRKWKKMWFKFGWKNKILKNACLDHNISQRPIWKSLQHLNSGPADQSRPKLYPLCYRTRLWSINKYRYLFKRNHNNVLSLVSFMLIYN